MLSIRSLLKSKTLYVLCAFLFIATVMQIESHQVCSSCPDAKSDDTVCLTCNTLHYDDNHKHGPPKPTPDVTASACAGFIQSQWSY